MKQLLCIAAVLLIFSSCNKQRTCTCSTGGSTPHEILGMDAEECAAYAEKVPERKCTFDE